MLLTAALAACGASESAHARYAGRSPWTVTDGLSKFPAESSVAAFTLTHGTVGTTDTDRLHSLDLKCERGGVTFPPRWIAVSTPYDEQRIGFAVVRLDSAPPDTVQWHVLQVPKVGESILEPDQFSFDSAGVAFLQRLRGAHEMLFVYSNSGQPDSLRFDVDSLDAVLTKMDAICGKVPKKR